MSIAFLTWHHGIQVEPYVSIRCEVEIAREIHTHLVNFFERPM